MKRLITLTAAVALIITGCSSDPYAEFRYKPADPAVGEQVVFENLSFDAEYVEWSFGDGTVSSVYSPIHTYTTGGLMTVELTVFGKRGKTDYTMTTINVFDVDPLAGFGLYTDLPTDEGQVPVETDLVYTGEQVEFYNTSVDAASYLWDFGDGVTSDLESPIYSYDYPGIYQVTLEAYNSSGVVSTMTKSLEVVEGLNSTIRITVLDVDEEYLPVEGASVILYSNLDDWYYFENPIPDDVGIYTSPLGKVIFEGLNEQRYYVDAYAGDDYNNDGLVLDEDGNIVDAGWIETQILEPNYIHDFFAYIWYSGSGKKSVRIERVSKKRIVPSSSQKKAIQTLNSDRTMIFSKERKK